MKKTTTYTGKQYPQGGKPMQNGLVMSLANLSC
jgi:hypothetical protein